jgi:hypothetical protein
MSPKIFCPSVRSGDDGGYGTDPVLLTNRGMHAVDPELQVQVYSWILRSRSKRAFFYERGLRRQFAATKMAEWKSAYSGACS